jgi:MtrB/PioB family decaheme-associated outer membrane protein
MRMGLEMKAANSNSYLMTAAATSLLCAFGPAVAAEGDELTELTKPSSSVELGVGYVSQNNQRFGQYSGLADQGGYGLLDLSVVQRDDATGTWLRFSGRNLGLDSRELRFENNRQGNWGYFIDFSGTPRFDPYTVTTRLAGIGGTTQAIAGNATAQEYHLKTQRDAVTLGFDKEISRGLGLQLRYRTEEKNGDRLWGQGTFGTWRFLTDPIDQTTRQMEATLNYSAGGLQLAGGYYGTAFENRNSLVNVTNAAVLFAGSDRMALPPDNQSHQLHLAGGYSLGKTARATFKLAYGSITQNDAFATTPVAGAPSSLNGRIDTTLAQLGLTVRPLPALTLRGDLRYENRDDKTPVFIYFPSQAVATATTDGSNEPRDIKTQSGKLEASVRLPVQFTLTGGLEYVEKTRNSPPVRAVSYREKTDETSLRAELRRSISDSLTGAVSMIHSVRGGSPFLVNLNNASTATTGDLVAPLHLADRDRNTWRLTLNWMPSDPLSLSFRFDESRDKYAGTGLVPFDFGPRKGRAQNTSLDGAYAFSPALQATAWVSRNINSFEDALCRSNAPNVCPATAANPIWGADLRNTANSFGLGLRAKASAKLELSADVAETRVRDKMNLLAISPTTPLAVLDEIHTKVTTWTLSAKYALQRNSGLRATFVHDQYRTDDWTFANWNYTPAEGGTTIRQAPNQKVNFLGLSYYYRF